ncbi:hypothetical protein K501DRAFT_334248 [Backusella circina FSU 941]|nr:hypothetical protein K501DRAFT_334248 [Backusella circina FSU 941]
MLKSNGRVWSDFIESTRRIASLKSPHLSPSSSVSSPKPSCHTSPLSPKTPPQQRGHSLDKKEATDSRRRTRLLLQQYGPDRYHHHYHHPYEHHTSAFLPSMHDRNVPEEWSMPRGEEEEEEEEEEEDEEDDSDSNATSMNSSSSPIPTVRKRRGNLPKSVTAVLKQWLIDHCRNPYPTEVEKTGLRDKTGLTLNQISNWFINARRRLLPQILDTIHPYASSQNEIPVTLNKEDHTQDNDQPPTKRRKRTRVAQTNSTYTLSSSSSSSTTTGISNEQQQFPADVTPFGLYSSFYYKITLKRQSSSERRIL